jgi:hypothetical protein
MAEMNDNDNILLADGISFIDESDIISRCTDDGHDALRIKTPALCAEADKWLVDAEACDVDPITLDEIPSDYVIRFRQVMPEGKLRLACRDVRPLKEWLERSEIEGKEFIDPATKIPYGKNVIDTVNSHPFSREFDSKGLRARVRAQEAADDYEFLVHFMPEYNYHITELWNKLFLALLPYAINIYIILWAVGNKKYTFWFLIIIIAIYALGFLYLKIKYTGREV